MNKEYSELEILEMFLESYPHLFKHIYKCCKLYLDAKNIDHFSNLNSNDEECEYWDNEELIIAQAMILDFGKQSANKIGKILVAATSEYS